MPNLGQGGCQAIEDAFVLCDELCDITGATILFILYHRCSHLTFTYPSHRQVSDPGRPAELLPAPHRPQRHRAGYVPLQQRHHHLRLQHTLQVFRIPEARSRLQVSELLVPHDMEPPELPAAHLLRPIQLSVLLRSVRFQREQDQGAGTQVAGP